MKVESLLNEIWYGKKPIRFLSILLLPFSLLYGFLSYLRSLLFSLGMKKTAKLPVPVISIGNISVGGTGKTPLVIYIAEFLQSRGKKVAVVSRGYKGKRDGTKVNVVSSGECQKLLPVALAGDEATLLAERLPGVAVLVGNDRVALGEYAVKKLAAQVIIVDDGFQHLRLHRDLNICLVDEIRGLGNLLPLPAGPLREFPPAIGRADIIVTSHSSVAGKLPEKTARILKKTGKSLVVVRYLPQLLLQGGAILPLSLLQDRRVLAFCGLGNPQSFRNTLCQLGVNCVDLHSFGDHHEFSLSDVEFLEKLARERRTEMIITTEKDAVKLKKFPHFFKGIFILRISLSPQEGNEYLQAIIRAVGI